ncbi:MAG: NAD(P)/FAD-dependent oxidoreductase [Melioribacteraceae bacterium]|nr:NAD(P)/FAD-dependent oxidoreductase [Melioribacteraceae bacterium]
MRKRVVIIGGGFGGLTAAKKFHNTDFDVLLIDKTNHHLFQPLLYQVATAALSPGDISVPIRWILRKSKNITVILGEAVKVDSTNNKLLLKDGEEIEYDYLIIAAGARHSYFGNNDWENYAPGLKTLEDAINIREKMLLAFEKAERKFDKEDVSKYMTFVIVGGGPTGVEIAGAIAEISKKTLMRDFRKINTKKTRIILVEGTDRILNTYDKKLSLRAKEDLEKLGVEVNLNSMVSKIEKNKIFFGNNVIETCNIIWAAGNTASPLLVSLKTKLDRAGRVIVNKYCSIDESPNIFVIGDAANFQEDEHPLPGIAPVAVQQGKYVADLIKKENNSLNKKPFKYVDKGTMATIGKAKAIAQIKKLKLTGFIAWFFWGFVHILFLINFRNKYKVMAEWIWYYFSNKNGVRLITKSNNKL